MNTFKAIIVDMGGVILLTKDYSPRRDLAEKLGVSLHDLEDLFFNSQSAIESELGSFTKHEHWRIVLNHLGVDKSADIEDIDKAFWGGDYLNQDLIDFVDRLHEKYKLGMISNAFKGVRDYMEQKYQFLNSFDEVVFSYEVGLRKPDVAIYHYMCEKLEVLPQEAIFVDDLLLNVQGAQKAGLKAIQFLGNEMLFRELNKILLL